MIAAKELTENLIESELFGLKEVEWSAILCDGSLYVCFDDDSCAHVIIDACTVYFFDEYLNFAEHCYGNRRIPASVLDDGDAYVEEMYARSLNTLAVLR